MGKPNNVNGKATAANNHNEINYARKPFKIGSVLKRVMEEQRKSKKEVAAHMKVTVETIANWFDYRYLPMEIMMNLSEFLQYNFIAEYHPNIKPEPTEADLQKGKMMAVEQDNKRLKDENSMLKIKVIKLEGKVEMLMEMKGVR